MSDIRVRVHIESGEIHNVATPPDVKTEELLRELLDAIPPAGEDHPSIELWSLADNATGEDLRLDRTLEENSVRDGQHLLRRLRIDSVTCPHCGFRNAQGANFCLRCGWPFAQQPTPPPPPPLPPEPPPPTRLKLHLHTEDGNVRLVEVPDERVLAGVLIAELVRTISPSAERTEATNWILHDQNLGRDLDYGKGLAENGVQSGDHLYLRYIAPEPPAPPPPPPPRPPIALWKILLIIAVVLALVLGGYVILGLGGHLPHSLWPSNPKQTNLVEIKVNPPSANVSPSGTVKFTALVTGASSAHLTWDVSPRVGSISQEGIYTAPSAVLAQTEVQVTATTEGSQKASGAAVVTILVESTSQIPPAGSTGTESTNPIGPASGKPNAGSADAGSNGTAPIPKVTPGAVTLDAMGTKQFRLNPAPAPGTPVQWSLSPNVGSISQHGLYTAPPLVASQKRVVVSSNVPNSSPATIILQPVAVTAECSDGPSGTKLCSATVTHTTNTAVSWSISPQTGSISPQGVYAPAHVNSPYDVTITARSMADPAKYYQTASLHIVPPRSPVRVTLNPFNPIVINNQTQLFSAMVSGAPDKSVTWAASGTRGIVGQMRTNGLFVPPRNAPFGDFLMHVTATSNADPLQHADGDFVWRHTPGPQSGTLVWSGDLRRNQDLTIGGTQASTGTVVTGALPGVRVNVHVNTPNCIITTPPSPANGWKVVVIHAGARLHTISISWDVVP